MIDTALLGLAQRHGTPLYVYDLAELRVRAGELRAALPAAARLLYSLKANPLPPVVAELRSAGLGAEVSSLGELDAAIEAGFAAAEVLYTGPGKSRPELEAAVGRGVRLLSCESSVELRRLHEVATAGRQPLRVLLRLQPADRPASGLSMADGRQFGFDLPTAVRACEQARDTTVSIEGFHVYLGSQLGTVPALLAGFGHARAAIAEVCAATGVRPRIVDLGGGFPWPYAEPGTGCALDGLREGLADLLADWAGDDGPELWFETGRRVVAAAGQLLSSVLDVKDRPDGAVVVLDAGINVLGGMSGLGRVMRPSTRFANLSALDPAQAREHRQVSAAVVGPLCTPLDRLAARTSIDTPRVGDVLRVSNVGGYGLTASLTSFLSRPAPPEVVVDGDRLVGSWQLTSHRQVVPLE
ncbi:MAG: type III PLP-dependent enzyme [Jatrophihabitans sp.]